MNIDGENAKKYQIETIQEDEDGISVPNWLIDVLKWIKRIEMGNSSLSFSCRIFKQLCWPKLHGNVKPYYVGPIGFYYEEDAFGNTRAVLHRYGHLNRTLEKWEPGEIIPIADVESPQYILGFEEIYLWYLDGQVIKFLENEIKSNDISLQPWVRMHNLKASEIVAMHRLMTIFSGKIFELDFNWGEATILERFEGFHRLFPEIFDEIRALKLFTQTDSLKDFNLNWLIKRRSDGVEKIHWLQMEDEDQPAFIERLKQEFILSTEPNSFFMNIDLADNDNMAMHADFRMENEKTGELLILFHRENEGNPAFLDTFLTRCQKDEEALIESEKWDEKLDYNKTEIMVQIVKFGKI